ncbi:MAG: sulfotransferase domain-containing protein [Hyphomicrobiales bacterium]
MPKPRGKIDWLASYPKSGNTWMRLLLANYFGEGDEPHDFNKPGITNGIASLRWRFDEFLGLSSSDLIADEVLSVQSHVYEMLVGQDPQHHWMKVHDAQKRLSDGRWLFPPAVSGAAIYLIRNPLDVVVSLAFHDGHEDMQRAVAKLCDRDGSLGSGKSPHLRQHLGSWSEHVESWIDQSEIPVLIVRYEDMLADAGRELSRVVKFARPELAVDEVQTAKAVAHTRFEKLKTAEDAKPFRETPSRAKRFFREGKAGDWRKHLSASQVRKVIDCHARVMARFGYESLEAVA